MNQAPYAGADHASAPPTDEALIDLFFQRIEDAIVFTKQKYGAMCFRIAQRILGDPQDAEECESDVYLRVWDAIPPDRPGSLKAYVARIARNCALDRYDYHTAACRNSALTEAFSELEPWLPAPNGNPEDMTEVMHFRITINEFLRNQTPEARTFFLRRYWYGESIQEIASACHVTQGKVKTSLFRTRERLRTELMRERIEL